MKKILACIWLIGFFVTARSQNILPDIKVYINNTEINYASGNNAIRINDQLSFVAFNKTDKKKLQLDDFTITFFNAPQNADKIVRQTSLNKKLFTTKERIKNKRVTISVKELLAQFKFTKMELELGKLFYKNRNMLTEVPLHSSKRTFSFLLIN